MEGLEAPRDPEKQRPFFYIMRDRDIFGSRQEDGRGIQFLYQSDGRLINSAQLVGNITDEKMLELLKTVEGFQKLVHSIGVSVETENPKERVEFLFQMYGKKDIYGGGSQLKTVLCGDGAESRIYLSDTAWTEDDSEPGQIQIILDTPERTAKASVRFYLNDGFTAPEADEEDAVDFLSDRYLAMIERSLLSIGDTARLERAIRKAEAGEPVTLAYIGGSITQGAGAIPINTECYAYKSYRLFAEKFAAVGNVRFRKAGVGGTPSELGMIRFDRDVLRDGEEPDVVVVEFAVNDEGDETKGDCFESLVRKILKLPNKPAVILLFSVFANDENLQERLIPIGRRYDLPMVSIRDAVTPQFHYRRGEERILSKNQFFYDMFHPGNTGHTIMADCLGNLFDEVKSRIEEGAEHIDKTEQLLSKKPVIGNTFETVKLLDKKNTYAGAEIDCGGFTEIDTVLQSVELDMELEPTPQFPYNWMFDGTKTDKTYFEMKLSCKALVMVFKDSGETDSARAEVYVDGNRVRTADPFLNGWLHCNPMLVIKEKESGEHLLQVQIADGDERKKFTILGFGYVE